MDSSGNIQNSPYDFMKLNNAQNIYYENTKNPDLTNVSLTKKWTDINGTPIEYQGEAQFELHRFSEKKGFTGTVEVYGIHSEQTPRSIATSSS